MTNTRKSGKPNALANRIAGLNDPSMGDERERDVILRAYTFGAVISTYTFFALGLLFAVIGAGMWTALLILGSGALGVAVASYCKREGVDYTMTTARVAPKRLIGSFIIGAVFSAAWLAAIVYHQTTGHPLIDAGLGATFGDSTGGSSLIIGAAAGALGTITFITITRNRRLKQARLEAARAADIEDED